MITAIKNFNTFTADGESVTVIKYAGLSTDTKPTDCANGSTFVEIDTSDEYMFNGAAGTWVKKNSSGGGGGAFKVTASNYLSDTATLPSGTTLDKTFEEILAAARAGQVVALPLEVEPAPGYEDYAYLEPWTISAIESDPESKYIAFQYVVGTTRYTMGFADAEGVMTYQGTYS